jgi:NIPSNAP
VRHPVASFAQKAKSSGLACCPVVELRQYALHPGKRDVLIDLFDREFIESQEAVGMKVIGQFRDLDDPNRFVWLRGFPDMESRKTALTDFYTGPVWKAHREAANATMIDSDNVLLLRPAQPISGFKVKRQRPRFVANRKRTAIIVATIYCVETTAEEFVSFFERKLKSVLKQTGAGMLAYFTTESSANTFPRLPVREGENVFVWFSRFGDPEAHERFVNSWSQLPRSHPDVSQELDRSLKSLPEVLNLSPTSRSLLR